MACYLAERREASEQARKLEWRARDEEDPSPARFTGREMIYGAIVENESRESEDA